MKKFIILLLGIFPIFSFAGIIMTTNNERIEDVSIQSETDSAIVYLQDGVEKSIAIEQVYAILYDNGNYKEVSQSDATQSSSNNDFITKPSYPLNNAMLVELVLDPMFMQHYKAIEAEAQAEYKIVFQAEIAKGSSKQNAKKIARQARDNVRTTRIIEYINNCSSNK